MTLQAQSTCSFYPGGVVATDKTMAAQVLAKEPDLELYRVDFSQLMSKFIGETEKNISLVYSTRVGVLFFDEAEVILGRRHETKEARDRYANVEIAYLLQRIEEYDGVTVLATNRVQDIDEAFIRCLHVVVDFPMPSEADRTRIWEGMLPAAAARDAHLDLAALAKEFDISGGQISEVFARAATHGPTLVKGPATILVWAMTLLFVFSSTLTVLAVFFDYPKPFPQLVRELFAKSTDPPAPAKPQALEVEAIALGQEVTTKTEHKTFTPQSESLNVGCESDNGTRVTYPIPEGVEVLGHSAKWVDVDKIRDHTAKSDPAEKAIVATGGIRGLDKDFVGNCPGGGHATLELTVNVRITTHERAASTIQLGTSQLVDKAISFSAPARQTFQLTGYAARLRLARSNDKPVSVEMSGCGGPAEKSISRTVLSTNIRLSCTPNGLQVERLS